MKVEIFLAGRILHAHGDRDLRGLDRALAQDREFLQHDLQFRIGLHQIEHVGHRAFAVAAIVVEEFDEGDVAVLVAEHDAARRIEDRLRVAGDAGFMFLGLGGGLALAEFGHRLFQHLGMREQVIPDDRLDLAALAVGEALRRCGSGMPQSASANKAGASRRNEGIGKSS